VQIMSNRQYVSGNRLFYALLSSPVRLVYDALIDPVRRRARGRTGARELALLDDHLLRDIGLMRAQVHAAAFGPIGPKWRAPADPAPACPGGGNVVRLVPRAGADHVAPAPAPLARRAAGG
jgi:uncharacterized protein YjiS (DUF1127 family)